MVLVALTLGAVAQVPTNSYVFLCFGDEATLSKRIPEPAAIQQRWFQKYDLKSGTWLDGDKDGKVSVADYFGYAILRATGNDAMVRVVDLPVKGTPLKAFVKGSAGYKKLLALATMAKGKGEVRGILYQPAAGESVSQADADAFLDSFLQDLGVGKETCPMVVGEPLNGQDLNVAGARYGQEMVQKAKLGHDTVVKTQETVTQETLTVNASLDEKGDMHATADKPMEKWEVKDAGGKVLIYQSLGGAKEAVVPIGVYDERITIVFYGTNGAEYSYTIE